MKVLVTGARGFIAQNLALRLRERGNIEVLEFSREVAAGELARAVEAADFVFHLAGVNRPKDPAEFTAGNETLTRQLCAALAAAGRRAPVVFASSTLAASETDYGKSKRRAEEALLEFATATATPVYLFRLPNVFGKWSRPNYNSAVATFCHNIARDLPITIHDASSPLTLAYVDDVVNAFLALLDRRPAPARPFETVEPVYVTTVGAVASQIQAFRNCRTTLVSERVGTGLTRALYATYVSHLPVGKWSYTVPAYSDPRGSFVEMLKTPDAGQFSFFTTRPGVTRGGHYHHTKTEKFLVLKGQARFRFRHMVTDETAELTTSDAQPQIVETIPGWAHDITNIGNDEMIVMLWANEIFDRANPDTIGRTLTP
jgi:UDP-2-acetamido-2,6-beta-L-arabino-hexul-4-ose reductase